MSELYIGTSGYDYKEWRGVLYPENLPREDFLSFYSDHFNATELNFSYYRIPDQSQLASMVERASGRIKFSIKGNKDFTHTIDKAKWKDVVKKFRFGLKPLIDNNMLLSVLLQFPQSFHYDDDQRRYLDQLIKEFSGIPLVVEFRHKSWQRDRVYDGLQKRNVGICICDMPDLKYLPAAHPIVSGGNAYFRLHGRNEAAWYGTDARERYNYLYDDTELESYIPMLKELSGKARLVQIYFNNHAKGNAVINARKMKILMQ